MVKSLYTKNIGDFVDSLFNKLILPESKTTYVECNCDSLGSDGVGNFYYLTYNFDKNEKVRVNYKEHIYIGPEEEEIDDIIFDTFNYIKMVLKEDYMISSEIKLTPTFFDLEVKKKSL